MNSVAKATISDSNNNVLATSRVAKTVSKIEVSIYEIDTKSFVPLGIKNKEKDDVKGYIEIKYEIKNQSAKECQIRIFVKGTTLPLQRINFDKSNNPEMCSIGTHTYSWDGFSEEEKYDSMAMSDGLLFVIETQDCNGEKSTAEKEVQMEYMVKWLYVSIDKNKREVLIVLRVSFEDGGDIGLEKKCRLQWKRNMDMLRF